VTRRAEESGDYGSLVPGLPRQMKRYLALLAGVVLALLSFLANYVFVTVDDKATQGVEANHKADMNAQSVEHLKEGQARLQESVVKGQQTIIDTLYTLPSKRRTQEKPVLEAPE